MTILVLGHAGQLATHLRAELHDAQFWGRKTLDAGHADELERRIVELAPKIIVNAAAYTAVDTAEEARDEAWRINAGAPAAAARAAETLSATLLHVSTDYVFDGTAPAPYVPDAPTRPVNTYGRTKLAGELAVQVLCRRHWILRTSWVFSEHGTNFVRTMLRLGAERDTVQVVADQFGVPTWAGHLAATISALVYGRLALPPGVYHAVGGPVVSWHAFAEHIFRRAVELGRLARPPTLVPIRTAEYPALATRPLRAILAPSPELPTIEQWPLGLEQVLSGT